MANAVPVNKGCASGVGPAHASEKRRASVGVNLFRSSFSLVQNFTFYDGGRYRLVHILRSFGAGYVLLFILRCPLIVFADLITRGVTASFIYYALSGLYVGSPERASCINIGCSPIEWQSHEMAALNGRYTSANGI